jgi:hypothetical protein
MLAPSANQVTDRYKSIASKLNELADRVFDKEALSAFCNLLISSSTSKKLIPQQLSALETSTEHLIGQKVTRELLVSNAYRVLANFHFIMEGMPIPIWDGSRIDASVVFLGVYKKRERIKNKIYLTVKLKLRTGLAAGIIMCARFTSRQISFFLQRCAGVKSFSCAIEEISGMKASLVVESDGDNLKVVDWKCTADEKKYNRKLAEARRDVRKCSTFMPCNTCPRTIQECGLAIWLSEETNGTK